MDYFVLKVPVGKGGLVEAYPKSAIPDWKYDKGLPLAAAYPQGARVHFSKNFPDARELLDFQPNTLNALIVSRKVRTVLEQARVANVEYLPVSVEDHRGTVVGADYAFANALGSEAAIDLERSDYRMGNIDKEQISRMRKLVLARERISPDARLFRLKEMLTTVLVREDLRQALVAANVTGCEFEPADGWKSRLL